MPVLKVCYSRYCSWFAKIDAAFKLNTGNFVRRLKNDAWSNKRKISQVLGWELHYLIVLVRGVSLLL